MFWDRKILFHKFLLEFKNILYICNVEIEIGKSCRIVN